MPRRLKLPSPKGVHGAATRGRNHPSQRSRCSPCVPARAQQYRVAPSPLLLRRQPRRARHFRSALLGLARRVDGTPDGWARKKRFSKSRCVSWNGHRDVMMTMGVRRLFPVSRGERGRSDSVRELVRAKRVCSLQSREEKFKPAGLRPRGLPCLQPCPRHAEAKEIGRFLPFGSSFGGQ